MVDKSHNLSFSIPNDLEKGSWDLNKPHYPKHVHLDRRPSEHVAVVQHTWVVSFEPKLSWQRAFSGFFYAQLARCRTD